VRPRASEPATRGYLDLAGSHASKAGLDRSDGVRRLEKRSHIAFAQVVGHGGEKCTNAGTAVVDSSRLMPDDYLALRLDELLARVAADGRAPGSGSAAALTVAFAASLVSMVARCSQESWTDALGVVAQAKVISERVAELANTDGTAWEEALAALRDAEAGSSTDDRRDFSLEQKLERAAAVPLEIASLGADAAALAALTAERSDGTYRADAAAAAALAAGGARAAAHLVLVNLGVRSDDPRLARALASEQVANDIAARLLDSGR